MDHLNLSDDGVGVIRECLAELIVRNLAAELAEDTGNTRDAFSLPAVTALAESPLIRRYISTVLGEGCFAVRAVLFNKNPELNWKVSWHQDCFIAVERRVDADGWGPWSIKSGVAHVRPPASVLRNMLTIRIHLDDCGVNNGPLRVVPASHEIGLLSDSEIEALRNIGKRWLRLNKATPFLCGRLSSMLRPSRQSHPQEESFILNLQPTICPMGSSGVIGLAPKLDVI